MVKLRTWGWFIAGIGAVLLRLLFGLFPELTEAIYSNGLFVLIRWIFDYTIALLPFPLILLLLAGLIFLIIRRRRKRKGRKKVRGWKARLGLFGKGFLNFSGAVVFFFLFLWGFNYARVPLHEQCGLKSDPIPIEELRKLAPGMAAETNSFRSQIAGATDSALTADFLPEDLEYVMRENLEKALTDLGYSPHGRVRCRMIYPKGMMRKIGITGIYIPFVGEGHVDASLHPIPLPFTIAHEMSHGYGFTDEGDCNFLAFLACEQSADPFIRYSGRASLFQYVRHDLRDFDPEFYEEFVKTLPTGIASDREAMIANWKANRSIIPGMAKAVNDAYLKSQGVAEGTESYDRLVTLAIWWLKERQSG